MRGVCRNPLPFLPGDRHPHMTITCFSESVAFKRPLLKWLMYLEGVIAATWGLSACLDKAAHTSSSLYFILHSATVHPLKPESVFIPFCSSWDLSVVCC